MTKEVKKLLTDFKSVDMIPIKVKLDITTLNMILAFLYKDSVLRTRKTQSNILKLIDNLDYSLYEDEPALTERIWVIRKTIECRIKDRIETDNEMIKTVCKDDPDCSEYASDIIDEIDKLKISHEESKYLVKKLDDILQFGYTVTLKKIWKEIIDCIDDGDIKTYKAVQEDLMELATSVINIKRNTNSLGSDQTFSLDTEAFENVVTDSLKKLCDRSKIFMTGMQGLNILLAPGYMSKRLYLYLAFPGKGKSTILLKSALDMKKYNKPIPKDPDKRPAVLVLTLENSVEETVERIFNMTVNTDDIRNYRAPKVIKMLRKQANLEITEDSPMDIVIKEYKNREIDTNDIYGIINDLADEGIEVVGLIVDYIKRLRPAERASDEKGELKNISNELKEIAKFFDIPVITAQQLNRSSATVVDAAIQNNKEDVTRLVGRDGIAGAWELIENADWVCIINPERKMDTKELFLTFKMLKRRYRSIDDKSKNRNMDYMNQPFADDSEIMLLDDFYLEEPLYLNSLATQFEAVNDKRGKSSYVERQNIDDIELDTGKKKKKKKDDDPNDFDVFNPGKSINF